MAKSASPKRPASRRAAETRPSPPLRPRGRALADFEPLSPAERIVLEACRQGEMAEVSASLPAESTADNLVRADFVRFLLLGGDERAPVHELGVRLRGAWLTDPLNLVCAVVSHSLYLESCRIELILAHSATLKIVNLDGSRLEQGLGGNQLRCLDLFFINGFSSDGEIRLIGARVEGDITCSGVRLKSTTGCALRIDRAEIGGSFYFLDRSYAFGEISLINASIGDTLACNGSKIRNPRGDALSGDRAHIGGTVFLNDGFYATGTVRLVAAKIGSNLELNGSRFEKKRGRAIDFECTQVTDSFQFRSAGCVAGEINLSGMAVRTLNDQLESYPGDSLVLDGFTYDRIGGSDTRTDAEARIGWLERQWPVFLTREFAPQPWQQLVKVLREMGHADEARKVAIAKHNKLRNAGRYVGGSRLWDRIYGTLVGYGYRPWRLLWIVAGVWIACAGAYSLAIRPHWLGSPAPLLVSAKSDVNIPCLVDRLSRRSPTPCLPPEPDYRRFVSLAYSAEVLLPVISLGSKAEWRPALTAPDGAPLYWGWALFLIYWIEIAFGWLASLLLVTAVGTLVKKE
jgi:hypothetical protein